MSSTSAASREPVKYDEGVVFDGRVLAAGEETMKDNGALAQQHVVVAAVAESEVERLAALCRRRDRFRIISLVLVVLALLSALASIAVAIVVFYHCSIFNRYDSPFLYVLVTFFLYIVVMIESVFSAIAALVLLVLLIRRPERVLLRAPYDHGKFMCLCISLVVLIVFAAFSFVVPILLKALEQDPEEPAALCIIPAFRVAALCVLLGVTIAHRRLR